jgi:hypothetical protein
MKVYYGYDVDQIDNLHSHPIIDRDEDFVIFDMLESSLDPIPVLQIKPKKTSLLFEDYGFFSSSGKCYVYQDMICTFYVNNGKEPEITMFRLQVDEELIAEVEDNQPKYIVSKHNEPLIKKWAEAYETDVQFILL